MLTTRVSEVPISFRLSFGFSFGLSFDALLVNNFTQLLMPSSQSLKETKNILKYFEINLVKIHNDGD